MRTWLLVMFLSCLLLPFRASAEDLTAEQRSALKSLIGQLENSDQRKQLVNQLKTLANSLPEEDASKEDLKGAAAGVVKDVADRMTELGTVAFTNLLGIRQAPAVVEMLWHRLSDPEVRLAWIKALINVSLALGSAYLGFLLTTKLLRRVHRLLRRARDATVSQKVLASIACFLVDLLPLTVFAFVAHLVLGLMGGGRDEKLVTLAWIYASVLGGLLLALARLVLQPESGDMRLLRINDESAQYGMIWTRRIGYIAIYGYFGLQVGLLLDLANVVYNAALHLLGLLVSVLCVVVIAQNRVAVAAFIMGSAPQTDTRVEMSLRRRLAPVWHWLAILYIAVLYFAWSLSAGGSFVWLARATLSSFVILGVGLGLLRMLDALFERGFRVSHDLNSRYPGLERRANRYIPMLHSLLHWVVVIAMVMSILQSWGANTMAWLLSDSGRVISGAAMRIGFVLAGAFFVWEFGNGLIERYLDDRNNVGMMRIRTARMRTLLSVGRNALRILVLTVGTLMVLAQLDVDIRPLLAGAGVFGVALGFGSQKLVQDVITGAFILFDDTISVGDVVDVGGKVGLVEAISIRNVRLRDGSGAVHIIPFSSISTITNMTKDYSNFDFAVSISYDEDIDRVTAALRGVGEEMRKDHALSPYILETPDVWGVDSIDKDVIVIKGRIKTVPLKSASMGREFNRRMKLRFDELGIRTPRQAPMTVHIGTTALEAAAAEQTGKPGPSAPAPSPA